jgi:hypothetical protein
MATERYKREMEKRSDKQLGEDQILLEQYKELRESIRRGKGQMEKRATRGIASITLIAGYAFYAENGEVLITIIPVVMGVLFITHIQAAMWIARLSEHMCIIEEKINIGEFCWEKKYGGIDKPSNISFYSLFTIIFLASIGFSLRIVQDQTKIESIGYNPSVIHFAGFYAFLIILMIVSATFLFKEI